jgi:hypothetical protein
VNGAICTDLFILSSAATAPASIKKYCGRDIKIPGAYLDLEDFFFVDYFTKLSVARLYSVEA